MFGCDGVFRQSTVFGMTFPYAAGVLFFRVNNNLLVSPMNCSSPIAKGVCGFSP